MKAHGFTLLDMMIVVAIIGILSTIAVPGYKKYVANAKTSEAKLNLDLIGKGAVTFFSEEHTYGKGMKVFTREYPAMVNNNRGNNARSLIPLGGMPYETGGYSSVYWNDGNTHFGEKHDPRKFEQEFNSYPWKELHFRITSPFYYSYNYQGEVGVGSNGKSYFLSTASACLIRACRAKTECDSGYLIVGGPKGKVSSIIDNSDFKIEWQCGKALLSDVRGSGKVDLNKY